MNLKSKTDHTRLKTLHFLVQCIAYVSLPLACHYGISECIAAENQTAGGEENSISAEYPFKEL